MSIKTLAIESLSEVSELHPEAIGFYKHNCMICFDRHGYNSGVRLNIHHQECHSTFAISWQGEVNDRLRRMYRDQPKFVDFGACTIALLLVPELTEFRVVEQSAVGTTIDYYLAPQTHDDTLIFNHTARLEVSGILEENESNTVDKRINDKVRRLIPDPQRELPTFIVVVEFSQPWAKMVEHANRA
jgi:hypothetical protein